MNSRLSVAIVLLALSSACSTTRVVRLDTGQGAPREYRPPSWDRSVQVSANDFEEALTRLLLERPLALRPIQRDWLVRASHPSPQPDQRWEHLLHKGFVALDEWDRLAVALGLSFDPMRDSIAKAVEETLAPQLFYGVIATGLVTWIVLAANPEPVFTKAAAIVSAVMLIYLGVDTFLEVVKASFELKRATDRATTFGDLKEAGRRFGRTVGPQVARVFVLAVTVVVSQGISGGAAWLASRLSLLPSFNQAMTLGASQAGLSLSGAGQVSTVAIVEGNLVISLAPGAVAMAAMGSDNKEGSSSTRGSGTNLTTTRQSAGTTYRFNTGHAFNRAHRTGSDLRNTHLTSDAVENAIMDHVNTFRASGGNPPMVSGGAVPQPYIGRIEVGGYRIEFSAVQTSDGTISVGTYYLLP